MIKKPEILSDDQVREWAIENKRIKREHLPDSNLPNTWHREAQLDACWKEMQEQFIELVKQKAFDHASLKGHNPIGSYADDCRACRSIQFLKSQLEEANDERN